jgi:hypothetical protein
MIKMKTKQKNNIENKQVGMDSTMRTVKRINNYSRQKSKTSDNSAPQMLKGNRVPFDLPSSRGINKNPPGAYLFHLLYIL